MTPLSPSRSSDSPPPFHQRSAPPVVLTIAGSDSGGGAGIQADLKTFQELGCFGTSALTAVTCQNTLGVHSVQGVEPELLRCQVRALLDDFPLRAAKTGMLFSAEIIRELLPLLEEMEERQIPLVVDPVMISTSGHALLTNEAVEELKRVLSRAHLITPNLPEAEALLGERVDSLPGMGEAAVALHRMTGARILLKGGHLERNMEEGGEMVDVYYDGESLQEIRNSVVKTSSTHGTGCTLSAAITAYLALGEETLQAIEKARLYLQGALLHAPGYGGGNGPLHHGWMRREQEGEAES